MSHPAPDPTARDMLAVSLKILGVPTDEQRLDALAARASALLEDGERLSGRAAPDVEPLVTLRLPGADREGDR